MKRRRKDTGGGTERDVAKTENGGGGPLMIQKRRENLKRLTRAPYKIMSETRGGSGKRGKNKVGNCSV